MANATPKYRQRLGIPGLASFTIACIVVASYGGYACQPNLRLAIPVLVGASALVSGALAVALYLGERGRLDWAPGLILGIALIARLFFLFTPPQLSDDIYRYLWDGLQTLGGANPYAASPAAAPAASAAQRALLPLVNHPELVTIYPPAAQLVFAAGAALGGGVLGMKSLLVLLDLTLCLVTMRLLRRLGLPAWRGALYAWCPLSVLEIAGSGHVDGAGILFLLLAIAVVVDGRISGRSAAGERLPFAAAGALFALAALVKLFPLALFPGMIVFVPPGCRRSFLAGFAGLGALLLLPFSKALPQLAQTLALYAKNWEFAGFAFNALRALTGSGPAARFLLCGVFLAALALSTRRLARGLAPLRAGAPGEDAAAGRLLAGHCYRVALAFLLLTPTLQPWYALCLAAFLPFSAGPAGLALCWSVFLAYRVLIPYTILGQWQESGWVTLLVFLAPAASFGLAQLARREGAT